MNMFKLSSSHLDLDSCAVIASAITAENERKSHMITETPEHLLEQWKKFGFIIAHVSDKVAGFIKLSLLDEKAQIYERWSLIVMQEFRWRWIAKELIHWITELHAHRSILSITTELPVVKINSTHYGFQQELRRENLPINLIEIMERPQKLLPEDRIFVNMTLLKRIHQNQFSW